MRRSDRDPRATPKGSAGRSVRPISKNSGRSPRRLEGLRAAGVMMRVEAPLEDQLAYLVLLDLPTLRARWAELLSRPAPKRLSRHLLARAIGYQIQAKRYGGLLPALRRRLERSSDEVHFESASSPASRLHPGARLMREWNGETHVVEVHAEGFAWNGGRYRSLSAVAYAITGTRWSGPRFFGLHERVHARGNEGPS